jgi:hypothetical protein
VTQFTLFGAASGRPVLLQRVINSNGIKQLRVNFPVDSAPARE